MQVTGCCASLAIRSMFAPLAAIRPAMAVMAAGASGLPSRVTRSRPPRAADSPQAAQRPDQRARPRGQPQFGPDVVEDPGLEPGEQ